MTEGDGPRQETVELRVHGVHGTSPAEMLGLDKGEVRQVAGDNLTGVYRSKSGELPYRSLDGLPVAVEAYSWGTLTSGVRGFLGWVQRALWLLLLPFALANLAYWARLRLGSSGRTALWGARLTRLGGLLLTVFMVLIPTLIGVNLVAWQCYRGDSPGCERLPGALDWMADLSATQRLAVGSVLPLLFVAVLWFLSRQSLLRYEEVTFDGRDALDRAFVLRHPRLWSGKLRTQQLQRIHLTVALATVVAFSGGHVVNHKVGGGELVDVTFVIALGLAGLATAWAMTLHPDDVEYDDRPLLGRQPVPDGYTGWHRRVPGVLLGAMCATVAAHLGSLWIHARDVNQQVDFVGDNTWFIGVFVSLTAVHLALFTSERMTTRWCLATVSVVLILSAGAMASHLGHLDVLPGQVRSWRLAGVVAALVVLVALGTWQVRNARTHAHEAWNGAGASVMLAAGAWVALLFTTGIVTATADYLNGSDHGVDDLVSRLGDPSVTRTTEPVTESAQGSTLALTGDVVVRDAVITLDGGDPVIRSGSVESERIFDVDEEAVDDLDGVALQKGRTRVAEGVLVLESDRLRIEDSCVRLTDDSPCSPESSRFLVGGILELVDPEAEPGSDSETQIRISSADWVELRPTSAPAVPLVVPQVLIWSPLAQTAWLVGLVIWLLVALLAFRRSHADIDELVAQEIPPRYQSECRKVRRRAAFAHRAERLLDIIGAFTSVLAIGLIVVAAGGNKAPWERSESLAPLATIGMYVALALGAGLVMLGSRVRTSEGARKGVGVLWDLTTFWPRAAHPLAPPCYAERVVPELRTRVDWALRYVRDTTNLRAGNRVVLSGHSQGSVIVCAVLSRTPRADLTRVRVITYGSQIRALYGRVFPAVFGPEQIGYEPTPRMTRLTRAEPDAPSTTPAASAPPWEARPASLAGRLHAAGGSWVNLFRRTDHLGFRVFSDQDRAPDTYVPEVPDVIVGDAGPKVNTHSGYQHTRAYREAVAAWTGEPVQADPVGTTRIPPLPL